MNNTKNKFWSEVDIKEENECWPFKRGRQGNGYGRFYINRYEGFLAHRMAWTITNGEISRKMYILHKCDNKICCNPKHLYCGTLSNNRRDAGERNPIPAEVSGVASTKLRSGEIWLIRRLKGFGTAVDIAKMFKVSRKTISNVWNSNKWLCREGYYT